MKQTFDNDDFERIVLTYQGKLRGFACRITHDREDAEDVVQEALFRAYRSLRAMTQERRDSLLLRPWLYTITRNAALNCLDKKRRAVSTLVASEKVTRRLENVLEPEATENVIVDRVSVEEVEELLGRLPVHLQGAARLRFVYGYTPSEIALESGKPLGTVKSHLHRAVTAIRRLTTAA